MRFWRKSASDFNLVYPTKNTAQSRLRRVFLLSDRFDLSLCFFLQTLV